MKWIPVLFLASSAAAQPALTVYNQNFAVVRDSVPLRLEPGVNEVSYAGATAAVEPESVLLRDPSGELAFRILEQSYRNDPADQNLLLKLFEGKEIQFERKLADGQLALLPGKIIRAGNPSPIIEMEGRLRFDLPGQPLFPSLGDSTVLQPTLSWQLEAAEAGEGEVELAYVTGGLSWNADYNLVLPEKGEVLDLIGWVSVHNESGKTFEEARLKLMAGDVRKIVSRQRHADPFAAAPRALATASQEAVTEKSFDDFHLYSIARDVTLRDRETKQVEFTRASGVKSTRFYVYDGSGMGIGAGRLPWYGEADYRGSEGHTKVASFIEFKNSEDNQLGIALPKGRARFYREDGAQLQFIGEAEIDHTPKDETLELLTGNAFDLVGERTRSHFTKALGRQEATEGFEIELRNRKDEAAEIRVVEPLFRWANWEITESSHEFTKLNAQKIEFRIPLEAGEEVKVSYTVKYSW